MMKCLETSYLDLIGIRALAAALAALLALPAAALEYSVVSLNPGAPVSTHSMNSAGQVAGAAKLPGNSNVHAVFFDGTNWTDAGTLGGDFSQIRDFNDAGQIAGYSATAGNAEQHAFVWTPGGQMVDLGTLGGNYSSALAINDSGQAVGLSRLPGNIDYHAFSWTATGGLVDLGSLGGNYGQALGVNASGEVIGYAYPSGTVQHGFYWTAAGGIVDMGGGLGGNVQPQAINDAGLVRGSANLPGSLNNHAFAWTKDGGFKDIGTFGGTNSRASAMNEAGTIVGIANTPANSFWRAFSWSESGGIVDLGTLGGTASGALAINASGQIAGYAYTSSNGLRAVTWLPSGGIVDLGVLPLGPSSTSTAELVNDLGQVAGYAYSQPAAQMHGFIWTSSTGTVDLNDVTPMKPPGMVIQRPLQLAADGSMLAQSNVGTVLLRPAATSVNPPLAGPIAAAEPAAVGASIDFGASFTDADTADTHTASWDWGDGSAPEAATVAESDGSGTATGAHAYSEAGIYTVSLSVVDSTGRSVAVTRSVVVYDASAGFVTGGGWIFSPAGAYKADENLVGPANFGFVSKYKKGATTPSGNTEFQFHAASLNFHSDTYDWLVVAGARAQYKGTGDLNGQGGYKFILTAIDGKKLGGNPPDRFRIKIWHYDAGTEMDVVDYDNQVDPSTEASSSEGTDISGGSIVIQSN